jgi:hypothetical protein
MTLPHRAQLGEKHQETVVAMHNLAELLLWEGSQASRERAELLQRTILRGQVMGVWVIGL